MKNIFLAIIATALLTSCASNTTFHTYYKSSKKKSEFRISSPAFIAKAFIPKEDTEDFHQLIRKVKHFKIMVFDEHNTSEVRKFERFAKKNKYKSLIKISDGGDKAEIYFLKRRDIIKEIVLKVKDDDNFVLIGLKSNISEEDFNSFLNDANTEVSTRD